MASATSIGVILLILGLMYLYLGRRYYLIRENFAPVVSWPGGVVSPPPYSQTASSHM